MDWGLTTVGLKSLMFTMMTCMISFLSQQAQPSSLMGHSFGFSFGYSKFIITIHLELLRKSSCRLAFTRAYVHVYVLYMK